jgi:hypothetical protein
MSEDKIAFDKQFLVSEEAAKNMTLNIDDRVWLERRFDLQDEIIKDYVKKIYNASLKSMSESLAEVVNAQNKAMFDILDKQTDMIKELGQDVKKIKTDVADILCRIDVVELKVYEHELRLLNIEKKIGINK